MVQRNSCHTVELSENIKELLMLILRHKVLKTLLVMQFLIRAIPFGTMVAVSCICLFVILCKGPNVLLEFIFTFDITVEND